MWLVLLATLIFIGWRFYRDERDFYDYLKAMRAERDREAMQWLALLEEQEMDRRIDDMLAQWAVENEDIESVNWKREGF